VNQLPRELASKVSCAVALPTSCSAWRLGVLSFGVLTCATDRTSTGACLAQLALNSTSVLNILAKFSGSSWVATK
jgi:hypothetical protein